LKHGGGELRRTFQLRDVAAIINDLEPRVRNLFMKSLAKAERDEFIVAAPNDERRSIDHAESVIEHIISASHRVEELANGVTIPGGHSLLKDSVNILVEALIVKC
jgi:hypothetical protein